MILVDTDGGVDDALCLALLSDLVGVENFAISAVFGNVGVEQAAYNAHRLLCLRNGGWDGTIGLGHAKAHDGFAETAQHIHGGDGLGGCIGDFDLKEIKSQPLGSWLGGLSERTDEQIQILGIGPATNIPDMIETLGRDRIENVTLMSGVFFDVGNITPYAEFNAYKHH